MLLSSQWITASWAIQSLVMLWIAGKLESEFLRQVAYLLYAIVSVTFRVCRSAATVSAARRPDLPLVDYLRQMVERLMIFGMPVASLAGAGWLLRQAAAEPLLPVGRDNDVGPWIGRALGHRGDCGGGGGHDVLWPCTWN